MLSRNQKDDYRIFINFVKEPPGSDSISPYLRLKMLQFFDIGPEVRMLSQFGINIFLKFLNHFNLTGFYNLNKIFLKLLGLEYPVFIQRSGPFLLWPPQSRA